MRFQKTLTLLMLVMVLVSALSAWARHKPKPFTKDRVQGMVCAGLWFASAASGQSTKPEQIDPGVQAQQHLARGEEFFQAERYDGAEAEYRAAIRLDPQNAEPHVDLGAALGRKGDSDGMMAEEREALRLNPNNAKAHFDLGLVLKHKHRLHEALQEYRAAYELDPKDSKYREAYEHLLKKTR